MSNDERRATLARAVNEPDWKPAVGGDEAEMLESLEASGWVELKKKRGQFMVTVTSQGMLRHFLWEGESS